jgi:nucleoside-triphosphatase THEP1
LIKRGGNIIVVGGIKVGKSNLVKNVLAECQVDYMGLFTEAVVENGAIRGYGIRMHSMSRLDVFAHEDFESNFIMGRYKVRERVFEDYAFVLDEMVGQKPPLIVIDEIGIMEERVSRYIDSVKNLLESPIPSLCVVQKRALYMRKIIEAMDNAKVIPFDRDNNKAVQQELAAELVAKKMDC